MSSAEEADSDETAAREELPRAAVMGLHSGVAANAGVG